MPADFNDCGSKYVPGMSQHIIPARVSDDANEEAARLAVAAHVALGCSGLSRTDTIVTPDGAVWVLETNTIFGDRLNQLDLRFSKIFRIARGTVDANFDIYNAINSGLVNLGLTAGAPNQMVTTYEYQALNHEVMGKEKALACTDCHGTTARMNLKQLGYTLKGAESAVCIQCHGFKANPGFSSVHAKHVTDKKYDCSFCHTFSRPERGLRTTK